MAAFRDIPGYNLLSSVYDGPTVAVWQGAREADALPVIIKATRGAAAPLQEVVRLKQEYEVARDLPVPGIVRPIEFMEHDGGCVLILEDTGGTSLWRLIRETGFSIESALHIAIDLAGMLGQVHQCNIVHKDIRPSNIIIGSDGRSVRLTGFGIASVVQKNAQDAASIQRPEGTIAYISPEQTGRMNCRLDWRSDLYSMGVTLFELFTRELPFAAADSLALVHAHIAQAPPPAVAANPQLPPMIGAVIARLLAKSPDERYQSAVGVQKDLQRCLESYRGTGQVPEFLLGRFDIADKFRLPHRLFGREQETRRLLAAFEFAAQGGARLLTISGFSGIGKSALVRELQRPIIRRRGYFISGKFDQFNRNIPYSSLIQAFQDLIRQVLTESGERIAQLKEEILAALGANAQVIVNVIPELAAIIGPQPRAPELPAAESQNRFTGLFLKFTQVFASKQHPLCIFLDDLQWADQPSLKLIAELVADAETRHLLLLGAYRHNEIDAQHVLAKTLSSIMAAGGEFDTIFLSPLNEADVGEMLREAFGCSQADAVSLAGACMAKTGGNPFFLSQFLRRLYERDLVVFEPQSTSWQWDIDAIRRMDVTDNVVTLMAERIQYLSERAKETLKLAACMGNSFSLATLATVSGKPSGRVLEDIAESVSEGLIVPVETATIDDPAPRLGGTDGAAITFHFLHDRVRQAAYSLFNDQDRRETHLRVGRLLLLNVVPSDWRKSIFDIVSHLNMGLSLIGDPSERLELARLNLEAGRKAKESGALDPAYRYFEAMQSCLPDNPWDTAYALTLDCHLEKSEAAYLCGNYEQAYALCNAAFARALTRVARARVSEAAILAYRSEGRNGAAVRCALGILEELGLRYPAKTRQRHLVLPLLRIKWMLRGKTDADLLALPRLDDPEQQAVVRVLTKAGSSMYITDPQLSALWILALMRIAIGLGRSSATVYTYSVYGILLCGGLREYDEANRFSRLVNQLIEREPMMEAKGKGLLNTALFVRVWREHPASVERALWQAYEVSQAEGDPEFAAISLYSVTQTLPWFSGENLATSAAKAQKYEPALKKLQQQRVEQWSAVYRQVVANCMSLDTADPTELNGEYADEERILSNFEANSDQVGRALFYVNKLILCCLFREFGKVPVYIALADENSQALMSQLSGRQYHLYSALALIATVDEAGAAERRKALRRANRSLRVLRRMESADSMISHHAPLLLEAELSRVGGRLERAADLYDAAIAQAKASRHQYEEALANELCGRFYLARGKGQIAESYLQRAYIVYRSWGGRAKLARLHTAYPGIGFPRLDPMQTGGERHGAAGADGAEIRRLAARLPVLPATAHDRYLDLESVLKATRTISGEIVLARLVEELLRIVLENAGAQRGILALNRAGEWVVEGEIGGGRPQLLQSVPLEGFAEIPRSVVNYVRRTQNSIVLDDAQREGEFTQDDYLLAGTVRSVLCMPIVNKGEFTGLLYLENSAAPGAFTVERLEILKVITAQIAISIENARLYESIERKVDERTRELQEKSELLDRLNQEMAREIEQRRLLEEELRKLATTDSLTGLLVRRRFFELGETEISRARRNGAPLSLMVLDIDHFKSINDAHGHAAGDEVLRQFSMVLRDSLRNVDIVCRFGGEEFVAILPETDAQTTQEVAARLLGNAAQAPVRCDGAHISYTISIGLTWLQPHDTRINQLVARADAALYRAKKSGRNRVEAEPPLPSAVSAGM